MKNKKKIIITIILLVTLIVLIGINKKEIKLDEVKLKEIQAYDNKNVSIMIYNNDKSEYEKYTGEGFPDRTQYVYNTTDSGCLNNNGDKINNSLNYDAINRKVTVTTRETVHCYMYFSSGKTLTLEKGENISKIYYKVNDNTEYSETNETVSVAVLPGNTYSYYAEASTGYTMASCYDNNTHLCSGTMPNENKTIVVNNTTPNQYTLTISKGTGVGEIYYKKSTDNNYTSSTSQVVLTETYNTTYNYYGYPSANYIVNTCTEKNPCSVTLTSDKSQNLTASSSSGNGATYLMNLTNSNTLSTLIKQTELPTTTQTDSNATTDYRYIGASGSVNNYVCLGTLQSNGQCQDNEHLYRIIGVLPTQTTKSGGYENRIKLIKNTVYIDNDISTNGKYRWTGQRTSGTKNYTSYSGAESNENNWEESTLNRVILNQTFYNSLDTKYQNMIGSSVWYLGGGSTYSLVSTMYTEERSETIYSKNGKTNPTYAERKIGLMYPSDYGYATKGGSTTNRETCLTTNLYDWDDDDVSDCRKGDWLFNSSNTQWTITPSSTLGRESAYVHYHGNLAVWQGETYFQDYLVRPVFNLTFGTKVLSGTGSKNSPYTISS